MSGGHSAVVAVGPRQAGAAVERACVPPRVGPVRKEDASGKPLPLRKDTFSLAKRRRFWEIGCRQTNHLPVPFDRMCPAPPGGVFIFALRFSEARQQIGGCMTGSQIQPTN